MARSGGMKSIAIQARARLVQFALYPSNMLGKQYAKRMLRANVRSQQFVSGFEVAQDARLVLP